MSRVGDSTHGSEALQEHDDKDKREERRAEGGERIQKAEDNPQEAAGYPQMRPPEVPPEGPTFFLTMPPPARTSGGFKGRGKRSEKKEKTDETREITFFFVVFRKVRKGRFPRIE